MTEQRTCPKCEQTQPLPEFEKHGRTMNWCRRCRRHRYDAIATPVIVRRIGDDGT